MSHAKIATAPLEQEVQTIAKRARAAGYALALLDAEGKNRALVEMAERIRSAKTELIAANKADVAGAVKAGRSKALIDRLTLTGDRIEAIADGLKEMAKLEDSIGEVLREWKRPNGIRIRQIRVPLGVIGMIYESRPNVTAESAGLCLKSGNAVILRGSSEAYESNRVLIAHIAAALKKTGITQDAVQLLPPHDRRSITILTQLTGLVDLIIARGSERMIKDVSSKSAVPVMGHGKGVCHVYIDKAADLEMAVNIAYNAKVQRPGVCNAMETLLIHESMTHDVLSLLAARYRKAGVEIRGDDRVCEIVTGAVKATPLDWETEYLDKIVSIKTVASLEEAIAHIQLYGSGHTDCIVTGDKKAAAAFEKTVDSSCVMVNASTRLHDGGVFGFGSEIGISTNKLHARGTMGLRELTTTKFLVEGNGQIRE